MTDPAIASPPPADPTAAPAPEQSVQQQPPAAPDVSPPPPAAAPVQSDQPAAAQPPAAPAPANQNIGKLEQLHRAGFTDEEVNNYSKDKGSTLLSAGFSQQEVNDYLGVKAPDTAPIRQMVQKNLTPEAPIAGDEDAEKANAETKNQPPPSFSQSLDTGMGMPVSKILSGGDAPMSAEMRGHLMDAYAKGHAMDAADFMQSAIPAAAQSVWYQKLWHATEAFAQEFNKTEQDNPLDKDTVNFLTKDSPYPTQGSALQRLYGITSHDAAQAVLLAARGGKEMLNTFPAAMEGFEAFSNKLGQESGHPDIGKNLGMAPQALMEAFPHLLGGERPPEVSEFALNPAMAARHVGAKISSVIQGANDLRQMIGEKLGKDPAAVTPQDVSSTIATSFKSKAPTAEDFINTAIVLLGKDKEAAPAAQAGNAAQQPEAPIGEAASAVTKEGMAATLREVYKDTGLPPGQVFADAKANPGVAADLAAGNVPKVYEPLVERPVEVDHDLHLPDDFREFSKNYEPTEKGTNEALRDYLLQKGRETGNEHLLVRDNSTGNVVFTHTSANEANVSASPEIQKELNNPNNDFSVHHNHPSETPLSPKDIASLASPGSKSITAHGENGALSQAALTDDFRESIKDDPKKTAFDKIHTLVRDAFTRAKSELVPRFRSGELDKTLVDKAVPEIANRALAKNGIIDYTTSHDISGIPEDVLKPLEEKIDAAMKKTLKEYGFDNGGKSGRISNPDEEIFGKDFGPAEVQSPLGGPERGGADQGDRGAVGKIPPPSGLTPEHQELEDTLGVPENMNPSQLGRVSSKIESIFSNSGKDGLPKSSEMTDPEFAALEDYARRVETSQSMKRTGESGSIPFAPELRPEVKEFFNNIKRDILNFTTPMATGSARAQASAQNFMNSIRAGQWNATRLFHYLTDKFSPEDLKNMWEKMDEASVHVQQQEANGMSREAAMADAEKKGIGHFGLPEEQKNIISSMSKWAQASWDSAKKANMVEGEGLPFWTPRMAAVIGEDGKWGSPGAGEGKPTLNPVGKNLRTSSGNLKERKYLTAAETEEAMKAHFGEDSTALVRDIRAMPIALQRLNQAIAGRTLINEIKNFSDTAGGQTVSAEAKDGYFTMDHPAFQSYRPKLEKGEDGKWSIAKDANGNELFEKTPLYISKEFEGPLKAVLSQPSSDAYKALMAMKGKSMSMIMFSPMIHNLVEYGRALPAVPGKVWNTKVYFEGNAAKRDPVFMQRMIDHGFDPIGSRFFKQDISSVMENPDLTPGRSWTAKLLGGLTAEVAGEGTGLKVKAAIDKMGNFWHNTLLWDQIASLQAGIAHNIEGDMLKNGFQPEAAATAAAHLANRYAGALPKESMGPLATKMANLLMFSRSFTVGNWGVMKDMFVGLPAGPKAKLMKDIGAEGAEEASDFVKRKSRAAFMMDIGLKVALASVVQDTFDNLKRDKSIGAILHGYVDRFSKLATSHQENPWEYLNLPADVEALSSTAANEPGKQDRVHISDDPNTGTSSYMRLPTGKIGEEFEGWATSPLEMMRKKQSTFVSPLVDIYKNEDYFGHPIYDKNARGISGAAGSLGQAALHIMKAQFPDDFIDGVYKTLTGTDRADNAEKTAMSFLGLTTSHGYPGGPEAGILAEATRRHEAEISNSLPKIKKAVEADDTDKARDMMTDLGMTPRQQTALIKHYKNPGAKVNAAALKTFDRIATPDEKSLMDQQNPQ